MNHKHVYMRIISHAKSEVEAGLRPKTKSQRYKFPNQYFEFHHILPKSLYPNWVQKDSNIVPLTAREHFFCHQLLTKIYPCKQMYLALRAFRHNPNADYKLTARDYESLKENNARLKQQYFQSEEFKAKRREIASTFCKSSEYKEKCRIAALKSRTPDVKKKIVETGEFFLTLKTLKEKFGRDAIVALFSGNAAKTGLHYEFV